MKFVSKYDINEYDNASIDNIDDDDSSVENVDVLNWHNFEKLFNITIFFLLFK